MKQNQVIDNFTILSSQKVEELEAVLWQMEHTKSGAHLIWLEREDENKTFSIAFRTLPWNDTGVFHILEHSVLCGSKKYPVKEPFVELMKSSVNTFLNAMTFPDKTVYPVSSRNHQDFINLLRIYMDAVLHPLLYEKKEIFCQEGWHYELDEQRNPSYQGVVFNEMKGALSSPEALLKYEMNRRLFPDTCYRYISGGDPQHIPELTYENFVNAHRYFYHPSNSYIFLDGSMDVQEILKILDEEYLCEYNRSDTPPSIPIQMPVEAGISEISYELSKQETIEGRVWLADGFGASTFQDREQTIGLEILADVLCGDNKAPLKRILLEQGLASDVICFVHDGIKQSWLSVTVKDIRKEQIELVSDTLYSELCRLAKEGLDHQRIFATLDNFEFHARQRDFGQMPQGLVFGIQTMDSWLYGGDPAANISVGTVYERLRKRCKEGYFEQLIQQQVVLLLSQSFRR